jgi:hypothetical protein
MEDNFSSNSTVVTEAKYFDVLGQREFAGNIKVSVGKIHTNLKVSGRYEHGLSRGK